MNRRPLEGRGVLRLVIIVLLVVCLWASAALKLADGYREAYAIPSWLFFSSTWTEMGCGVGLLLPRTRTVAAYVCVGIALAAILMAFLVGGRPCGCLGAIILSRKEHLVIASVLGMLSILAIRPVDKQMDSCGPGTAPR